MTGGIRSAAGLFTGIRTWSNLEMQCKSCGSPNQSTFNAEMNVHLPGQEGLDKPTVWIFPELVVCLDCGFAQCVIPETELSKLARGTAA